MVIFSSVNTVSGFIKNAKAQLLFLIRIFDKKLSAFNLPHRKNLNGIFP